MTLLRYVTIALAGLVALAAASPLPGNQPIPDGHVSVFTAEGTQIMDKAQYLAWLTSKNISHTPPSKPDLGKDAKTYTMREIEELLAREPEVGGADELESRDMTCEDKQSLILDSTETFVDWDVQMAPVICANGDMLVAIAKGYSITNTVSVSNGVYYTISKALADWLQPSFSRAWTTSNLITTTGTVKSGNCGTMITQPIVTRWSGRAYSGCVGSLTYTGAWRADSHKSVNINGVAWVEGAISMCSHPGTGPPLNRCNGQGTFI